MRKIILVVIALHTVGCAIISHDRTQEPVASNLAGACFALAQDSVLAKSRGIGSPDLVQAQDTKCFPISGEQPGHCVYKPKATLGKGARFTVVEITDTAKGETGRCWSVTAKLEEQQQVVTIPACLYEGTESPIWLAEPKIPARVSAEHPKVQFNPAYAVPCT